ncbi:hypothetical protein L1987_19131 [Smallanthus sonchifolius]|uniref:Uncharacterized protein n=1 Tax=Smallanthus sonchifolius TaxID=185202 RepID=A0ACB9J366_9ASTR|nr:hypothetical protein L1987_19131 [Smallanthus sonchifolius]
MKEFQPPVASTYSTSEDFWVETLPVSTRLNPRVPDPASPAQNIPSTTQDDDVSSPHDHSPGDAVIDKIAMDNSTTIMTDHAY